MTHHYFFFLSSPGEAMKVLNQGLAVEKDSGCVCGGVEAEFEQDVCGLFIC